MMIIHINEDGSMFRVFDQDGEEVENHGMTGIQLCVEQEGGKVIAGVLIGRDVTEEYREGFINPTTIGPNGN